MTTPHSGNCGAMSPPSVQPGDDISADEGATVGITFTFDDPGQADTHTATIDWGDETEPDLIEAPVSPQVAFHVYPDNGIFTVNDNGY